MVGIYARLSREDDKLGVSESIDNQIKFLKNYANLKNWGAINTYIDDGYTGTNFDRPGFKKMIDDIEAGRIDIVITKDLSRLGRDYIDTGYYIEKYFPSKRVRYIAVNDGVDTLDELNSNNEITPFKAVINDMYAKDISKKVKSALLTKAINGESIKPFAPYGYVKKGKNDLVVDTRVAENVIRIFEMYLNGNSKKEICNYLNNNDIIPPLMYKMQYTNYKNPNNPSKKWGVSTISNILKDRIYIGDLVQHKYSSVNYKIKKVVKVEKDKNIVIENHHQPIIEREKFYKVQQLLEEKANECKRQSRSEHILTGIAFCGKCGARITYTKNHGDEFKIICSNYKKHGKKCCEGIYIGEKEVVENIKNAILDKIEKNGIRKLRISNDGSGGAKIKELTKEKQRNMRAIKQIYSDMAKDIICKGVANEIIAEYVNENSEIDRQVAKLKAQMTEKVVDAMEEIKQANGSEVRSLFYKLIEKIEIANDVLIVYYKFKNKITSKRARSVALGKGELLVMWTYNKVLQYPINIKSTNPKLAKYIISQYGGPDGELGAALRYLSQRFGMPDQNAKAILNDIRHRRMGSMSLSIKNIYCSEISTIDNHLVHTWLFQMVVLCDLAKILELKSCKNRKMSILGNENKILFPKKQKNLILGNGSSIIYI